MQAYFWQGIAIWGERHYCRRVMHIIYPKRLRYPHKAANHLQATAMACALGRLLPVHIYPTIAPDAGMSIPDYINEEYHFPIPNDLHIHALPYGLTLYNFMLDCRSAWGMFGKGAVAYTRDVRRGGFCARMQSLAPRAFPLIHEVHDLQDEAVLARVLRKAAGVVFIHERIREEAAERFGYTGPSCIAQSGFDGGMFRPSAEGCLPPEADSPFTLVYVGTIREDKGVDLLLEMMPILPGRVRLKLVGEPSFRSPELFTHLLRAIPDHERRVNVTGQVPHHRVAEELRGAHAMLLPPVPAGKYFSQIKVFEALGCGLPIIAAPLPHLTSFLTHGQTAFFAADGTTQALAEAAKTLSESPYLQNAIHTGSLRLAGEYTWDARAARIKDFMEAVTGMKAALQ